jgi:dephospho-CoA kinase
MNKIIGIIGPRGSGKTTFAIEAASLLRSSVGIVRVADVLKETLLLWGLPSTTANLQMIAEKMREMFGTSVLSNAVKSRIESSGADVIFVDGIRGPNVVNILKEYPNVTLIYVDAPEALRFGRVSNRGQKSDEWRMDSDKFVELDTSKQEQILRTFKDSVDKVIINDGTYEAYCVAIKDYLHTLDLPIYETF